MLTEKDDLFHVPASDDYRWTETNWWGFIHVPEKQLTCYVYVWLNVNMKVAFNGIVAWKGRNRHHLAIEYFDYRQYLPFPKTDLNDYQLANGLQVKILEPLKKFKVDYVDAPRGMELHFIWDAFMPPMEWANGAHFDHCGKVDGTLTVRGETHTIDTFAHRDHSWGIRDEGAQPGLPPYAWTWGVFDRKFAFMTFSIDESAGVGSSTAVPKWSENLGYKSWTGDGKNPIPTCWLWLDGQPRRLMRLSIRVDERGPDGMEPVRVSQDFTDEHGELFVVKGEVTNMAPIPWNYNWLVYCCQVRWECRGKIGWGDFQYVLENDNYRLMMR